MNETTITAADATATLESATLTHGAIGRELFDEVVERCGDCCKDDIIGLVDELPAADAINEMKRRREDARRFFNVKRSETSVDIPLDLVDEIEHVTGYAIEERCDKIKSIAGMGWDDCQHFDLEIVHEELYALYELALRLKRIQFEIARGIRGEVDLPQPRPV